MGLAAASFTLFPQLPVELRLAIWHHAFDELYIATRPPGTNLFLTFEAHLDSIPDENDPTRPDFDRVGYHFSLGGPMTIPDYRIFDIGVVNVEVRRSLAQYLRSLPARWSNALTDGRGAIVPFDPNTDVIEMDIVSLVTMLHYMIPRRHRIPHGYAIGPRAQDRQIRGFEFVQRLAVPYGDDPNDTTLTADGDIDVEAEIFRQLRMYFLTGLQDIGGVTGVELHPRARASTYDDVEEVVEQQVGDFIAQQGYDNEDNGDDYAGALRSLEQIFVHIPRDMNLMDRFEDAGEQDDFDDFEAASREDQEAVEERFDNGQDTLADRAIRDSWNNCVPS